MPLRLRSLSLFTLALLSFAAPLYLTPSVLPMAAQSPDFRRTQADQLLKQGNEQLTANQPEAALQTLQAALKLYRDLKDRAAEGQTLKSIGNAYQALKQYDEAIAHQQQALEIAREIKDTNLEARALLNIGLIYTDLKDYKQGISYGQQALEISREIKDRNLEARALNSIGWAYHNAKESAKAIEYYKQSLTVSQSSQNIEMENKTLANLGRLYGELREFNKAIGYHQQRLALAQKNQNIANEAEVLGVMCVDYREQHDFENSIQACQQASTLYRELKNRVLERTGLVLLVHSYQTLGRYEDAIKSFQQILLINQQTNNLPEQSKSLCLMSFLYHQTGQYSKEIDSLKQGLSIAKEINRLDLEKDCLSILVISLRILGEYAESTKYSKQYLAISQQTSDFLAQVKAIESLLWIYGVFGDVNKVLEYTQKLKALAREANSPETKARALRLLGETYNYLAERKIENGSDNAIQSILSQTSSAERQVSAKFEVAGHLISSGQAEKTEVINFMADRNRAYASSEIKQAIEYLNESLTIIQKITHDELSEEPVASLKGTEVLTLNDLRRSYMFLSEPRAISYGKQVLQMVRQDPRLRENEANALGEIGNAYFANLDFAQAIQFHQQSLLAARRDKKIGEEGEALQALGISFLYSGDLIQAEKSLFEAARVSESLRANLESKDGLKISFFEGQQQLYRTLEEVLIAQNKPEVALEVSERGRARIFIEQLRKRHVEQPVVNQAYFPSVQEIKQTAQQHNATLVVYSVGINPSPGINKSQSRNLFIWIVQPTGKIEFRTVDLSLQQPSLVALINLTRQAIGARGRRATLIVKSSPDAERISRNQQAQQLQQLHQLLIEPIASLLPTDPNQRVIFIPQGELFLVPFPALQDAKGTALIEQHTILTAPSIQVLDLTRQAAAQKSRGTDTQQQAALVVGNPTMPKVRTQVGGDLEQLSNLSGAETEAEAIATLLKTKPIIGKQATKAAIVKQMANARLIHLATHGLLDDFKGLGVPGAIALAPDGTGKDNDGLLTADEILDLKLNANLVVLSACDTGRGRITGDGVIGLSRSLITAGVPSIIVSLWKVPDASTAFLMTEFYRHLQQQPDKAIALRQAMQATKQKYPDPLDWAAFTLIGEAE
jgi:CHAT domain-containing protein